MIALKRFGLSSAIVLGALLPTGTVAQPSTPALEDAPRLCAQAADQAAPRVSLPATAKAIRERSRVKVLAIGATPLNERDQLQGQYGKVEAVLESTFKGVDVEIVDRGVSGELVRDAKMRIKTEVALHQPDLVFWQVGVADALAHTPIEELKLTLAGTVRWLKQHNVDVVLIGLKYQRSLSKKKSYQDVRQVVRDVVRDEGILRIGHYESIEAIDRIRNQAGLRATEHDLSDVGSLCLADFLSRALAVGLFVRDRPPGPAPDVPAAPLPPPGPPSPNEAPLPASPK